MDKQAFFHEHYLNIDVILGRRSCKLKELKQLHIGSVLKLDKLAGEPLDVKIDDKYVALGEALLIDDNFGIRISKVLNESDIFPTTDVSSEKEYNNIPTYKNTKTNEMKDTSTYGDYIQDEIDRIITPIVTTEPNADEQKTVYSGRKVKIYDYKRPVKFDKFTIQKFGNFINKACSVFPSVLGQHLLFKLDSITQISKTEYNDQDTTSFIDQWEWYSTNNYVEISIDDFVIKHTTGIIKKSKFYSQNELSDISSEISSILVTFLLNTLKKYSENSDIPQVNHLIAVPSAKFVFNLVDVDTENCNCYKQKYSEYNNSMYVSFKIKVLSSSEPDSFGYINLNIPADDLQSLINSNKHDVENNEPYLDAIQIDLDVSFGSTIRSISEIMRIDEGIIIELDRVAGEDVTLRANGQPIALGEIVVIDEWLAIKITKLL